MGRCIIPSELQLSNCCIFNVTLQPWPRSQLPCIYSANNCFHIWGIFLILSITWPCSTFLSPLPAHQHRRISPAVGFKPQQQANKAHLAAPWSLSCQAIIRLLLPDQPPKWNWCSICGYQHKGIWRYIWGSARAQGSCRVPACQSQARAWSQSSDQPICSHNKGTRHKHSWKEVPWDNVSPSHCPKFRDRCRWSAKLLCLAAFNKTHRLIYQPE